jgi:hypothetical protein
MDAPATGGVEAGRRARLLGGATIVASSMSRCSSYARPASPLSPTSLSMMALDGASSSRNLTPMPGGRVRLACATSRVQTTQPVPLMTVCSVASPMSKWTVVPKASGVTVWRYMPCGLTSSACLSMNWSTVALL